MIGGAPVRNTPLTLSQIEAYTRDGALLVSGLIPPELCRAAEESMWEQMSADPRPLAEDRWARDGRPQPRRDDRSTWPVGARNHPRPAVGRARQATPPHLVRERS